jgi:hypothetical protein
MGGSTDQVQVGCHHVSGSGFSLGFFYLGLGLGSQHGLSGRVLPLQAESKRCLDRVMGLFWACSKRRGAGRMTRSNEETVPFEERALGCRGVKRASRARA